MARVIAFHLALFALPFVLYAVFVYATKPAPERALVADAPVYWLVAAGLALTIVGFFVVAALTGTDPGGIYVPAELRDGEVIPGRIVVPDAGSGD